MMQVTRVVVLAALLAAVALPASAQGRYTVRHTGDIVEIQDTQAQVRVSILTTVNNAYEMVVKGQDVIRKPFGTVDDFRARPGLNGIPLLWPYANRLDEQAFYFNGRKYSFDPGMGNTGRGAIPIHGYVTNATDWRLVEAKADATGAWATGQLDFYKNPSYMSQFPFAHTLQITYLLKDGGLEVRTRITNLANEPMPVAIGFHPYFQLTDSTREDWTLSVGARTHWLLSPQLIPTGDTEPITNLLPNPKSVALKDISLDDVFTDLERDAQGRATVTLKGKSQRLDVQSGPKYKAMVVYSPQPGRGRGAGPGRGAPPGPVPAAGARQAAPPNPNQAASQARGSVAIEPMAAISNALNMAHRGQYQELQSIPPGGVWEESFWVQPSGF
jgi:aldose 1-epimerase